MELLLLPFWYSGTVGRCLLRYKVLGRQHTLADIKTRLNQLSMQYVTSSNPANLGLPRECPAIAAMI